MPVNRTNTRTRRFGSSLWLAILLLTTSLIFFGLGNKLVGWVGGGFFSIVRILPSYSDNVLSIDESNRLQEQVRLLTKELSDTKQELEELNTVKALYDFVADRKHNIVYSSVIGFSPDPGIRSLSINRGRSDGLIVGQAVITEDGYLIGILADVMPATSIVRLLSDSQSRVLVQVQNASQSSGLLQGNRGLSTTIEFLPQNDPVEIGQPVVTSGGDEKVPPGLVVGLIEETAKSSGELFQTAVVRSPVKERSARVVGVVIN